MSLESSISAPALKRQIVPCLSILALYVTCRVGAERFFKEKVAELKKDESLILEIP